MGHVSNKPGRHETSIGGMIGAMIVLVACILAYVGFREVFRDTPEVKPEAVEWASAANAAIDAGHPVVRPELPAGWIVTNVRLEPTKPPLWDMSMYTDGEKFAGLHQEDERVADLVETYIDDEATEGDPVRVGGELAGEWQVFTDDGGDTGLVLQRETDVVMVYGSAPKDELVDLAGSLTTKPVAD